MDAPYYTGCSTESLSRKIIVPWEPEERDTHKWCYRCRRFKPYEDFYKKAMRYDGLSGECKLCDNAVRLESLRKKNER